MGSKTFGSHTIGYEKTETDRREDGMTIRISPLAAVAENSNWVEQWSRVCMSRGFPEINEGFVNSLLAPLPYSLSHQIGGLRTTGWMPVIAYRG